MYPFSDFRLRNIFPPAPQMNVFGSQQQEPQYIPQQPAFSVPLSPVQSPLAPQVQGAEPDDNYMRMQEIFKSLYQPETTNIDRMNTLLNQIPQRGSPSILSRIGGMMTGIAHGPEAQQQAMYAPYLRQMGDWQAQFKPVEQAANLERQENINRRNIAQGIAKDVAGQEKESRVAEQKQQEIDIKDKRADAYIAMQKFKIENPGMEILKPKGGVYTGVDKTGKVIPILSPTTGNPIPVGTLSEKDEIDLKFQGAVQLQDIKGAQAQELEKAKQPGREALKELGGWTAVNVPDPNDPTKLISARMNTVTGETVPLTIKGKEAGPLAGKTTTAGNKQPVNMEAIREKARATLDSLRSMLTPEGKLQPDIASTVGGSRLLMGRYLPASEARKGESRINNLKANLVVDLIGEMKSQSRTGATGFGALNLKELGVLENAASRLDPGLSEKDFADALREVEVRLKKIINEPGKLSADELLKKYGGK